MLLVLSFSRAALSGNECKSISLSYILFAAHRNNNTKHTTRRATKSPSFDENTTNCESTGIHELCVFKVVLAEDAVPVHIFYWFAQKIFSSAKLHPCQHLYRIKTFFFLISLCIPANVSLKRNWIKCISKWALCTIGEVEIESADKQYYHV